MKPLDKSIQHLEQDVRKLEARERLRRMLSIAGVALVGLTGLLLFYSLTGNSAQYVHLNAADGLTSGKVAATLKKFSNGQVIINYQPGIPADTIASMEDYFARLMESVTATEEESSSIVENEIYEQLKPDGRLLPTSSKAKVGKQIRAGKIEITEKEDISTVNVSKEPKIVENKSSLPEKINLKNNNFEFTGNEKGQSSAKAISLEEKRQAYKIESSSGFVTGNAKTPYVLPAASPGDEGTLSELENTKSQDPEVLLDKLSQEKQQPVDVIKEPTAASVLANDIDATKKNEQKLKGKSSEKKKKKIFNIVEQMPDFPGGESAMFKYMNNNLRYPDAALDHDVEGKVYVQFVVQASGKLKEVKVLRGLGLGCDEEAVRIVKSMPRWNPGIQFGDKVPVRYTIPVIFKIK